MLLLDIEKDGLGESVNDLLVLPPDTTILRRADLPNSVSTRIRLEDGDHVVSRSGAAVASVVIDNEGARLLGKFRQPRSIVNAVISYSSDSNRDAEEVLEESWSLIKHLFRSGLLARAASPRSAPIKPLFAPASFIGGFKILSCIKVSAGTEVYKAANTDNQFAAVKIVRPGAPQSAAEMLATEVRLLETLDATVTPRVLAHGQCEERPFLVTQWFDGVPVSVVAKEWRSAETTEARSKLIDLCCGCVEAYAHLHRQGVVHGDIHFGNLLVDDSGRFQIVDLGLGRAEEDLPPSLPRGGVAAFLEPEYARAALRNAALPHPTPLSEQYALAVLVYSLLTGRHYLDLSLEQDEAFRQIAANSPLSFEQAGMRWWPEAEPVLKTALEKQLSARFASTNSFALALRQAAASKWPVRGPITTATASTGAQPMGAGAFVNELVQTFSLESNLLRHGIQQAPACSVSHGAAGVGYGLYQLACRREDAALLALADIWSMRALSASNRPDAFYSEEIGLTPQSVGTTSPFHTVSGVHCVRALVDHGMGNPDARRASIAAFLAASDSPCSNLDLTLGRSGSLLACALLMETAIDDQPAADALRLSGNKLMGQIWDELNSMVPLAEGPEITHLGVAHGWSGMAYAAMRWCQVTGQNVPPQVEQRLQQLAELAEPVGRGCRWPWHIRAGNQSVYMPGWCNGSAGYVYVWVLAHQMLGHNRYLQLARQAAWNAFEEPGSNGGLCCGLPGRAYGLLCLYKYTRERAWLQRASELAARAMQSRPYSNSAGPLEQRRHSLFKGELGLALLLEDLRRPDHSALPFFESQTCSQRLQESPDGPAAHQ